ncbi:MAG: NAD(+) synthase [Candidatus Zixiibacteriota bacterium]|nr:MAG: NAD(+) synthase [candidate division Zixibacteria bacterium]
METSPVCRFNSDVLLIDCEEETRRIEDFIRREVFTNFRKAGAVVGMSGGVDSAVMAALCVRSLGAEKVLGLILPERESSPVSAQYARKHASSLGIPFEEVEVTSHLESLGAYTKRDHLIKKVFPEYGDGYTFKLVLPQNLLDKDRFNIYSLRIESPDGESRTKRLSVSDYLGIVAASNMKQRTRMIELYYFAERANYLVAGTTNRTEVDQGFFVKYGDGGVDIEPIAHLYKVQVYQLARYLDVPPEIIERTPTPDTFTSEASDEEFYFCLPYDTLDLLLYAKDNNVSLEEITAATGLSEEQIQRAFRDFDAKRKATETFRHMPPAPDWEPGSPA